MVAVNVECDDWGVFFRNIQDESIGIPWCQIGTIIDYIQCEQDKRKCDE